MLYLIYGPDAYRIGQRVRQLSESFLQKHPDAAMFVFDALDEGALEELEDSLRTVSLFDPAKLIQVRRAIASKNGKELAEILIRSSVAQDAQTLILISDQIAGEAADKKTEALRALEGVTSENLQVLQGANLTAWIKKECLARGADIDAQAGRSLIELAGADSQTLINEIEKLCNYAQGREINSEDVRLLVVPVSGLNVFDLVDALAQRNKARAIDLLFRELATGKDPYEVMPPVIYQFRNLIMARDLLDRKFSQGQIVKALGVHPYVARKTLVQAQEFTAEELRESFGALLAMDTGAKRGTINLSDELYRFIF